MILFFKSCFYIQISKEWLCPCIQIFRKGRKKTKINDCLMKAGMSIDGSLKKMQNWIQVLGEGGNVSLHWNDCFSLWNMKQRVIIVMCLTLSHHHEKWEDDIKSVSYYYQLHKWKFLWRWWWLRCLTTCGWAVEVVWTGETRPEENYLLVNCPSCPTRSSLYCRLDICIHFQVQKQRNII